MALLVMEEVTCGTTSPHLGSLVKLLPNGKQTLGSSSIQHPGTAPDPRGLVDTQVVPLQLLLFPSFFFFHGVLQNPQWFMVLFDVTRLPGGNNFPECRLNRIITLFSLQNIKDFCPSYY